MNVGRPNVEVHGAWCGQCRTKTRQQSVIGRTKPSDSDPFVLNGFVQLSQEANVFVQMHRTDSEEMPRNP